MAKPNLIICCLSTASGGIDEVICQLLNGLNYSLFEETILISFNGNKLFRSIEKDKPIIHRRYQLINNKLHFYKTIISIQIDMIKIFINKKNIIYNSHEFISFYLGFLASLLNHDKSIIVSTVHQLAYNRPVKKIKKILLKTIDRFVYKYSDGIIAVSENRKNQLIKVYGINDEKIKVIFNGINVNNRVLTYRQKIEAKANFGINTTKIIFGYSGRLSKEKGPDRLIKSFAMLDKKSLEKIVVLLAGDGPLEKELRNQIDYFGLADYVKLLGFQENMDNFYSAIDILVQPSLDEGLSISILEAMSYKLPIIASRVGGNNEIIVDKLNGWLFSDENELLEIIRGILGNNSDLNNMGDASYEILDNKFNRDLMTRGVEQYFYSLKSSIS